MQAVILVGGEGTRLRPLTSGTPKPIVTFVDRPFMAYMLQWLARHDVTDVVLCCGFLSDKVQAVLGDGSEYGVRLRYVEEPEPRGTAGALKFAEELLEERFLLLNGDILTDVDLSEQIAQHEQTGAQGTLGLVEVEDPSAYGLVLCHEDNAVSGFLEKPVPEQLEGVDRYFISAGIYVLERAILYGIPGGRKVSIETEVWPRLVGAGLYGYRSPSAYWMDIGTPERYLQGTADILQGHVDTEVADRLDRRRQAILGEVSPGARVTGPVIIEEGATVAIGAHIVGPAVVGPGVVVGAGCVVDGAVLLSGVELGPGARVRDAIVSPGVHIGPQTTVEGTAVLGEGVVIGARNVLAHGVKVHPGTHLPDGAITF